MKQDCEICPELLFRCSMLLFSISLHVQFNINVFFRPTKLSNVPFCDCRDLEISQHLVSGPLPFSLYNRARMVSSCFMALMPSYVEDSHLYILSILSPKRQVSRIQLPTCHLQLGYLTGFSNFTYPKLSSDICPKAINLVFSSSSF